MKIRIVQECGQKWYRWRSWRVYGRDRKYHYFTCRKLYKWHLEKRPSASGHGFTHRTVNDGLIGFAVGPIIFTWR